MINRAIANKGSALFSHNDDSRLPVKVGLVGLSVVALSFFGGGATRSLVAVLRAPVSVLRPPPVSLCGLPRALRARAPLPRGGFLARFARAPR